jgi:DNA-binding transcriptional LysR family regulator
MNSSISGVAEKPVIPSSERAVPAWNAHRARAFAQRVRWDDLKAFLAVCDALSFRAAAVASGLSVNTLRRRVDRLEEEAGATLLRRDIQGVTLTDAGQDVAAVAREMHSSAGHEPDHRGDVLIKPGEIRIGCTEALGSVWLTPRLMELHTQVPDLTISLQHSYDAGNERSREIDVGITFSEPQNPELIRARIGALHFMLFASPAYLSEFGQPTSFPDLRRNHRFIEQAGTGLNANLVDFFFGTERPPGFVPIRSNSSMSVYWAVVNGAGVAAFPTYVRSITKDLIPLTLPFQLRFDLWIYYHESARSSPAIRATVDWIKEAFDGERYPWFADEFVHPDAFPGTKRRRADVVELFEGLAARVDTRAGDPPAILRSSEANRG